MAIVGAFLGGTGGAIAAGYSELIISWQTTDGNNLSGVVFTLTGPATYTLTTDSAGVARATVQAGTYTLSVNGGEGYSGLDPRTIVCNSREVTSLVWVATRIYRQQVTISSPISSKITYSIVNESGETEYSGTDVAWSPSMQFNLWSGAYTLNLTLFGDSASFDFEVATSPITVDISSLFCKISLDGDLGGFDLTAQYNSETVGSFPVYVLRTSSTRTISFSGFPSYSGVVSTPIASCPNISVTPSVAELTISPSIVGSVVTITSAGNLSVPLAGKYHVLVIGGGASGGAQGSSSASPYIQGGGGGRVADEILDLTKSTHAITIGAGGTPTSYGSNKSQAGGASSFGTLLSAAGGNSDYGSGGSGGGGGGGQSGANGLDFGGGGTGGGYSVASTGVTANGGKGGRYGSKGDAGGTGIAVSSDDVFYYASQGANAAGGNASSSTNYGGGGGGGGHGARGGNGGNGSSSTRCGGGGGGGGIAGGNGGDGGSYSGDGGYGGYGYGAGGGGMGHPTSYDQPCGGGGGGGGLSYTKIAGDGSYASRQSGAGAPGAIRIQWVIA